MKRQLFRPQPSPYDILAMRDGAWDFLFAPEKNTEIVLDRGVAIVTVAGPLEHHPSWLWDSYDEITERVESAAREDEALAIVLHVDSPGGDANGLIEAHKRIRRIRAKYDKPIYAYSDEQMSSAAYGIGSAADEIYLPETGSAGSIGAITSLEDRTKANAKAGIVRRVIATGKRKGDGDPNKPMTKDVIDAVQERVDYIGNAFFRSVAKARGLSVSAVRALEAEVFQGKNAVKAGIADGVMGWDAFLAKVRDDVGAPDAEESEGGGDDSDNRLPSGKGRSDSAREVLSMKTVAQLTKDRAEALKLVTGAKTDAIREKAIAKFNAVEKALIAAKAKAKKAKDKERDDDADDDADDESDDDADDDDAEDDDDADDDADDDDDDSTGGTGSSSTGSTGAVDRANEKELAARSGLRTYARLFRLCQQVTGESEVGAVFGALDGMGTRLKEVAKVEARVAKLETRNRGERVDSMLERATQDGRVTPAAATSLRAQGMKDPAWLKGHLKQLPKAVRSDEEASIPNDAGGGAQTLDQQGLSADQRKVLQTLAADTGQSVDEFAQGMAARSPRTSPRS